LRAQASVARGGLDIGIFPLTARAGSRLATLEAFAQHLSATPHRVSWVGTERYATCDLAIVYGSPGAGAGRRRRIRQAIVSQHEGPVLIVETPLLGRKVPALERGRLPFSRPKSGENFDRFRISLNGSFWDNGIFCNEPADGTRWGALRRELGIELEDYRKTGDHILLIGQVPGDASLRGLDVFKWIESTVIDLAVLSDRPIVIRPHPLSGHQALGGLKRRLQAHGHGNCEIRTEGSLRDALRDAWATVTYSSGAAIDSLLAGVPAFALCPASMAWPVTDHELGRIEAPTLFDRRPWLDQLAHSQWTISEIADGTVWARFKDRIAAIVAARSAAGGGEGRLLA
jgi:hypothetical protein